MRSEAPIAVFEHQPDAGAGFLGDWLHARSLPWTVVRDGDPAPDPRELCALVTLGSSRSAYAPEPAWIPRHLDYLRDALASQTPVIGICFGAQALALAAGGSVARAPQPEIGWVRPQTAEPALAGPWLAWHLDAITAPAGATVLARTDGALQAFRVGAGLGIQFHPEVTPASWAAWTERNRATAPEHLGEPAAFAESVAAQAGTLRARQFRLLDWWRQTVLDG